LVSPLMVGLALKLVELSLYTRNCMVWLVPSVTVPKFHELGDAIITG
jgi:hypothetical protein